MEPRVITSAAVGLNEGRNVAIKLFLDVLNHMTSLCYRDIQIGSLFNRLFHRVIHPNVGLLFTLNFQVFPRTPGTKPKQDSSPVLECSLDVGLLT